MSVTIEEMWNRLAAHQSFADRRGYGPEWAAMCAERTVASTRKAADAGFFNWGAAVDWAAQSAGWALEAAAWAADIAEREADAAVRWIERAEGKR